MVRDADQLGDIEMVGDGWQLRSAISEVHHRYVEKFGAAASAIGPPAAGA